MPILKKENISLGPAYSSEAESIILMVETWLRVLHLYPWGTGKERQVALIWAFENLKPGDILLPTRSYLPPKCYSLNLQIYEPIEAIPIQTTTATMPRGPRFYW